MIVITFMGLKARRTGRVEIDVVIERKHPDMAAFVVIPARRVAAWSVTTTTTIEGTLDGVPLGRRSLHRWDDERWFIELPRRLLETVGKAAGDRASLAIAVAPADLPEELQSLIDTVPEARAHWDAHTPAQRRMFREEIFGARTSETRARRARRALLPAPPARPQPVRGLRAEPRRIVVRIVARDLPGRNCGPYADVCVGLAQKVGCDPEDVVPGDSPAARWETAVEVREKDGAPAFRGPAVNGPPGQRFLYLNWMGRKGGQAPAMFRRAKLRLDAVPAEVLAGAIQSGVLVGELGLTARDGMPVCASVIPPAIAWST